MKLDVLLIHPPTNFHIIKKQIIAKSVIGYGLLHIAACLHQRGYKVAIWDLEKALLMGGQPQDIERQLKRADPIVIGIEMNWIVYSAGAIQTAEFLKRVRPHTPVIIGGTHASLFAREIVQKYPSVVDAVLKGEAEKTFLRVVEHLEESERMGEVGGLVFSEGRQLREIPMKKGDIYANIDDIPPYSYRLVKDATLDHPARAQAALSINTTRGPCRIGCTFCIGGRTGPLSGRTAFSTHSPEWIVNQINLLLEEGTREFDFQDFFFLFQRKQLLETVKALRREKINEKILAINMTAIPGILDGTLLEELSRAGVCGIDYGTESGSNRVLSLLNRPVSKETILNAVKITASKGIIPWTFWMTGLPGERPEDTKKTLEMIHRTTELGAIPKWVTPLVVIPGTELFERAQDFGIRLRLKSFEDFSIYSDLEMKAVSWYPEAVSHETEYMSRYDILRASLDLKLAIFKRREEILANFMNKFADTVLSYHPQVSTEILESSIKERLGLILKTFF